MKCIFSEQGFCNLESARPGCDGEEETRGSCPFWAISRALMKWRQEL